MRLKCIKLAGFKSFVDPTTVSFPSKLCAVVGPNGCGKSNIIDAVRWVMGESSAKNLRGEQMADVIFNGSSGRKPVGQATIELIFDNSENRLRGEYAKFTDISIKRKITRDGHSTYMFNGTKCRRRDITDIFLGTGLGARSYSIIEQGMVSRLIESKPEELRVFIEEAAGISKYKERRRETENRIRRTRENLERLADIRDELGRQLQHLHRQSQAAQKYGEFKQQERETTARLSALRWQKLGQEIGSKQQQIQELELKIEGAIAQQRALDAQVEKHISHNAELNDKLSEVQGRYYSLGSEIARIEQSIEHHIERVSQMKKDLIETEEGWEITQQELNTDLQKITALDAELKSIEPDLEHTKTQEADSGAALELAEQLMQNWQHEWDEFNQKAEEPRQIAEVEQSRIQQLESIVSRGLDRKGKLLQEQQSLGKDPELKEIDKLSKAINDLELQLDQHQKFNLDLNSQIESGRGDLHRHGADLDESRSELQKLKGRLATLESLQSATLGRDNQSLNQWLESRGMQYQTRLGESISVASGWEVAVEAVLGDSLQSICVEGITDIATLLQEIPDGFLCLVDVKVNPARDDHPTSSFPDATLLSEKVAAKWDSAALLPGIFVTETLEQALAFRNQMSWSESVVTRKGIWLGKTWIRVKKEVDAQTGILERKGHISELLEQVETLQGAVEDLVQLQTLSREKLAAAEQEKEANQKIVADTTRHYSDLKSQLSAKVVKVEQTGLRRERLGRELEELLKQLAIEQENVSLARANLQSALDAMEQDVERKEILLQQRDERRQQLDQIRQKARHDKDMTHQLALRQQSVDSQLRSTRETMDRMATQVQRAKERMGTLKIQIETAHEPMEEMRSELEDQLQHRLQVEEKLNAAKAEVDSNEHALRKLEHERSQIEESVQSVRDNLMNYKLKCAGAIVKQEGLEDQLKGLETDIKSILQNIPDALGEDECERELEKISNRIQRLGPINLAAIDEYDQQSERKAYLDSQNEDLEKALTTLENAIRKIDTETRTRFKETFDKINIGLQALFPKIFGGGHAYLEMTGDDLLDTGVAIMARPPGKRNSTIHLLSGGEKAMVAIALVFSIFQLNPSPFCMLDEVDAPLDDANVARYARLVEEMSENVQFIFITHNKITMETAKQLLGVTMHEAGVSRIVAVDIDEATELAAM